MVGRVEVCKVSLKSSSSRERKVLEGGTVTFFSASEKFMFWSGERTVTMTWTPALTGQQRKSRGRADKEREKRVERMERVL